MAVINAYVDANLALGKIGSAALINGVPKITVIQSFTIGASDSAASVYRVFKGIPSDAIILSIKILNDAVAGVTAGLIGLYDVLDFDGKGAIIGSGNQLCAGFNFSSANTIASVPAEALTAVAVANREKQLWELASQTQAPGAAGPKAPAYDICLTMASMTTNTANICVIMDYVRGV
jgi:hypothetical protein